MRDRWAVGEVIGNADMDVLGSVALMCVGDIECILFLPDASASVNFNSTKGVHLRTITFFNTFDEALSEAGRLGGYDENDTDSTDSSH